MLLNAIRSFTSEILAQLTERQRNQIYKLFERIIPGKREVLAHKHLKGSGIEIGAMHNPLPVPRGVSVQYIDYLQPEQNYQRFKEIRNHQLVRPHIVEDGFILPSFEKCSVDFLIANHVLEHSDNALKTIIRWAEVIRPNGILFLSVPICDRCFDKGRVITTVDHFKSDFELERSGDTKNFRDQTRKHYSEWLSISLPAILASQESDFDQANFENSLKTADELLSENLEIHFHTFTSVSFEELLNYFCANVSHNFRLIEIVENGIEVIGILEKK